MQEKRQQVAALQNLFCGQGFGFPLGVERAEVGVARAARSAAVAAIGEGERTQTGTVFLGVAEKRPTERFVDIKVSRKVRFEL